MYQNRQRNDVTIYWPEYSNPGNNRYVSANPTARPEPDKFYLPALNIQADLGPVRLISTTAYFHRDELSGYDGTLYNLGYYQTCWGIGVLCSRRRGLPAARRIRCASASRTAELPRTCNSHQPAGQLHSRVAAAVDRSNRSSGVDSGGILLLPDRQYSLEEIHDPMADALFNQLLGQNIATVFGAPLNPDGSSYLPMGDSYFNRLLSHDRQIAGFGEVNFNLTDTLKLTAGVRVSKTSFSIQSPGRAGFLRTSGLRPRRAVEQRDPGHAQGGHPMAGRPE